jgi:ribosomal protein S18 acetylase RimI-like enzyme
MRSEPTIRRELRPGDLEAIVAHHARVYAQEHGVDGEFAAMVAKTVAEAARRGFPGDREGIWIVEVEGKHAGSLALTDEGGEAVIRWVLIERSLRGRGLGRRLVAEAVSMARTSGYELVALETFSELTAAARIYRDHGFAVVWEDKKPRWGRAEITYQRYELPLRDRLVEAPDDQRGEGERDQQVSGEANGRGLDLDRPAAIPAREI